MIYPSSLFQYLSFVNKYLSFFEVIGQADEDAAGPLYGAESDYAGGQPSILETKMEALALTQQEPERQFLQERIRQLK